MTGALSAGAINPVTRDDEFGEYTARAGATAPGGAPGPLFTLRSGGRAFTFRRTRRPG